MEPVKYCYTIMSSSDIFQEIVQVYVEKFSQYKTLTYWVRKFKSGFMVVMDEVGEERPSFFATEDNFTKMKKFVLQGRCETAKQLSGVSEILTILN